MGLAVVTVASGGLPIVETTSGTPVTEAANLRGVPVTKVVGKPYGLPVTFETIGVAPSVTYVTLDPATVTAVTLSGGNRVATSTGTTSADQGARVAAASGKTSGKFYFEITLTNMIGGANLGVGIGTTASTYTALGGNATVGVIQYQVGSIWANGVTTGINFGLIGTGNVVEIAVDLDNRKWWSRRHGSNWNNNVTFDPATNVGGVTIPAGTMVPVCVFGGSLGISGNVFTANFGASAFGGPVPAGFTSGWPA